MKQQVEVAKFPNAFETTAMKREFVELKKKIQTENRR